MTGSGKPTVSVVVCTLNEAEGLPHVLPKIPPWVDEVLLVDGGSTDGTVEVAHRTLLRVRILRQRGVGKGDGLKYGIRQATGDIIVTVDADGETDPEEIPDFVAALMAGNDVAKGSRLAGRRPPRMSRYRWFGNKVLAHTFNLLYGTRFTDVCSGYNAFWKRVFLQLDPTLDHDGFQMEQQMLASARKLGLRVVEVSHHSQGRIAGTSKARATMQGILDWLVIIRERFR